VPEVNQKLAPMDRPVANEKLCIFQSTASASPPKGFLRGAAAATAAAATAAAATAAADRASSPLPGGRDEILQRPGRGGAPASRGVQRGRCPRGYQGADGA